MIDWKAKYTRLAEAARACINATDDARVEEFDALERTLPVTAEKKPCPTCGSQSYRIGEGIYCSDCPMCVWCNGSGYIRVSFLLCRTCHGTGIASDPAITLHKDGSYTRVELTEKGEQAVEKIRADRRTELQPAAAESQIRCRTCGRLWSDTPGTGHCTEQHGTCPLCQLPRTCGSCRCLTTPVQALVPVAAARKAVLAQSQLNETAEVWGERLSVDLTRAGEVESDPDAVEREHCEREHCERTAKEFSPSDKRPHMEYYLGNLILRERADAARVATERERALWEQRLKTWHENEIANIQSAQRVAISDERARCLAWCREWLEQGGGFDLTKAIASGEPAK